LSWNMNTYLALIERASDGSYSAFVPDLPGCVSCGDTLEATQQLIEEAVKLHLESLRQHGEPVPPPAATVHSVHAA
jgi:predicted RNase H-like HicB family nuclease